MDQNEIETILKQADEVVGKVVPLLGPYGPPIKLGLDILAVSEPAIYAQIVKWLDKGEPTDSEKAELKAMISRLKNPDQYFA